MRRRGWRDALMSATGLVIVLLVLVSYDGRLREQVQLHLSSPSGTVADASHSIKNATDAVWYALKERSLDRTPLLVFVIGASVLLLFMLRT